MTGDSFIQQNSAGFITIGKNKAGNRIDIANNVNGSRILSGIKGGAFTATSKDAVNGAQLCFMSKAFTSYFGDGAGYGEDNKWSAPIFVVKTFDEYGNEVEKTYSNVADAFSGVNNAITALSYDITELKDNSSDGEKNKKALLEDGNHSDIVKGFPFMMTRMTRMSRARSIDEAGNVDTPAIDSQSALLDGADEGVSITVEVANGKIEEGLKQAVNGGQLYATRKSRRILFFRVRENIRINK
nr:hypothetical protein [Bartonella rattaustraliani]